jgi:predicted transcriptional regulator
MAVTNAEVQQIVKALRQRGGRCTLRELAAAVGRNVNGLSQTLNSPKFTGILNRGDGRGGDRVIALVEPNSAGT